MAWQSSFASDLLVLECSCLVHTPSHLLLQRQQPLIRFRFLHLVYKLRWCRTQRRAHLQNTCSSTNLW